MALVEENYELKTTHASFIDPSTVSDECLPTRLARCAECLQEHTCNESCLVRKLNPQDVRRRRIDLSKKPTAEQVAELLKCKKNFPKVVPEGVGELKAHVLKDFNKIIRYNPARDDGFVNNYHPVLLHLWGANMDLQVLHGKGMFAIVYIA